MGGKSAKNQTGEELNQMRYATIKIFQILTTNGKTVPRGWGREGDGGERWGQGGDKGRGEKVGGKSAKNQTGEELNQMRYATIKIFQILTTNGKTVPRGWGREGDGGERWGQGGDKGRGEKVGGKSAKNQTGEELNQMRYATIKIFQILTTNGKTVA